jgi:hypothetical protein
MKEEPILRRAHSARSVARFIVWYAAGAAIAGLLLLLDGFPQSSEIAPRVGCLLPGGTRRGDIIVGIVLR